MKFLVMEASLHAGENLNVKPIITTPSSTFFQSHVLATKVRLQNGSWILNTGHFPFDQDFLVNFRQFPVVSGTAFSKNCKKGDILAWYIQIFESFFPKFSFFCSWNFQNVWYVKCSHFRNSTVLTLSGNFPRKFLYHSPPFTHSMKFLFLLRNG